MFVRERERVTDRKSEGRGLREGDTERDEAKLKKRKLEI